MHISILGEEITVFKNAYETEPLWRAVLSDSPSVVSATPTVELTPAMLKLLRVLILKKGIRVSKERLACVGHVHGLVHRTRERMQLVLGGDLEQWIMTDKGGYKFRFDPLTDTLDVDLCEHEITAAEQSVAGDGFDQALRLVGSASDQSDDQHVPRTARQAIIAWMAALQSTVLTTFLTDCDEEDAAYLWAGREREQIGRLHLRAQRLRLLLHAYDGEFNEVRRLAELLSASDEAQPEVRPIIMVDQRVAEAAVRAFFPGCDTCKGGLELLDKWFYGKSLKLTNEMQQFQEAIDTNAADSEANCKEWRQRFEKTGTRTPQPERHQAPPGKVGRRLTWQQVETGIERILGDLEDWRPDLIVGINRGGAIVGGMLAKQLQIRTIGCIALVTAQSIRGLNAIQLPQPDPTVQQVLVVDEAQRSGWHCATALADLRELFPGAELRTAMLVNVLDDDNRDVPPPDYFSYEDHRDVRFPWDRKSS